MARKVAAISKRPRRLKVIKFADVVAGWMFCPLDLLEGRIKAGEPLARSDAHQATLTKMRNRRDEIIGMRKLCDG